MSLDSLNRRIAAVQKNVRTVVQPAVMKSAEEIAATMRNLAPVDTGDLRNSIVVTPPGQSTPAYSQPGGARTAGEVEALITAGNHAVRYPHLVEYGTDDTSAQPYFWPAFRLGRKRAAARIKRAVAKAVREGWK